MDPLTVRLCLALGTLARTLITAKVAADRVYVKPLGDFAPDRDSSGLAALLVSPTPNAPAARRKLLGNRTEAVIPVTVVLVGPGDGLSQFKDVRDNAAPQWREQWRESFLALAHGKPAGLPAECKRVTPDGDVVLDGGQFEAKGLWWAAVPVRCLCRLPAS